MIIAAPVYKDSISPVFDSSKTLLCLKFENKAEVARTLSDLSHFTVTEKAILIKELNPDYFICNALSGFWYNYFMNNGIRIISGVQGCVYDFYELTAKYAGKQELRQGQRCRRRGF